jgi:hypothetical protein
LTGNPSLIGLWKRCRSLAKETLILGRECKGDLTTPTA